MRKTEPHEAVDYLLKHAAKYAKAKAERVYIENFLRSKKALLMAQTDAKTVSEREAYAYSHHEYIELLEALKVAVEIEENLKWHLEAARLRIDVWRTEQASNRAIDRAVQ